ncbi:MAG: hypothetical protein ABSF71_35445 [Terriglobia bacterium]
MATPCPRCGTTKTESVRHGFIYNSLWNMGYHLRRCSFCNRKRIFKRHDRNRPHPDDWTAEELTEHFNRKIAESKGLTYIAVKGQGEIMASDSTEKSPALGAQSQKSSIGVAEATEEIDDYRLCPKCGSTAYHRSHRRWYEKLLGSPRMARCVKCDHRFPYPRGGD